MAVFAPSLLLPQKPVGPSIRPAMPPDPSVPCSQVCMNACRAKGAQGGLEKNQHKDTPEDLLGGQELPKNSVKRLQVARLE